MAKAVIRTDIAEAMYQRIGLSRSESARMVGFILGALSSELLAGNKVKISAFGNFETRQKQERVGRNFQTGETVTILPRQVIVFRPSPSLKRTVNDIKSKRKTTRRRK
ncbi:MAG: integration host factor subunit alpha [Proteobacteria bacterium]|nr:integration host factor subunit alpha [Pseudomonadota bacterium]